MTTSASADSGTPNGRAVSRIYAHDHDHGSAALRRAAAEALHTAYGWLREGTYTGRAGRRLCSATGHLSIAAGWLAYDSGRAADSRSLCNEALAAARIADDRSLEGHASGCLSLLAKASGRPRKAVAAAHGAQSVVRTYGSPQMLALFALRGRRVGTARGRERRRQVDRPRPLSDRGPRESADPNWLEFYAPAALAGLDVPARADLDQHERAAAGAEQAVLPHGDQFARNE
ncbi:hypothetical protein ABTZ59_32905 [Streptomyces sp. NPDC094034]|uniref:hypothetical protein n=1 Tax=Streptomyces sp. NPDC094034 TaxID=3155309 RepID=UPI003324439D